MSSTNLLVVPAAGTRAHAQTSTFRRVLSSEWIKTRTLRSTWLTAGVTLLIVVVLGAIAAGVSLGRSGTASPGFAPPTATTPLTTALAGANLAVLIVAVWGSIFGAREFSSGMIRTTLAAVPRRLRVLWAKVIAFAAVAVPAVVVGVLLAFFLGMAVLSAGGADTVSFTDTGVARVVLGTAYYIVGLGLIGLALGVLLRVTAAAIGTVVGAVLFIPTLANALLPDSWSSVLKYLPSNAGAAFTNLADSADRLTPGQGSWVFTAWIVVALAGAAVALVRRDA